MELPDWALFCERCGERVIRLTPQGAEDESAPRHYDAATELAHATSEVESGAFELPTMVIPAAALKRMAENLADQPTAGEQSADAAEEDAIAAPAHAAEVEPEEALAEDATEDEVREEAPLPAEPVDEDASEEDAAVADGDEAEAEDEAESDAEEPADEDAPREDEGTAEPSDSEEAVAPSASDNGAPTPFVVLSQDEAGRRYREHDLSAWEGGSLGAQSYVPSTHRVQRQSATPQRPPMALVAGIATAVLVIFGFMVFRIMGAQQQAASGDTPQVVGKVVSRVDAERVVASLNGWWKTDRELDGRYWHIEDKNVQTYAADGKLASETVLDTSKVERMSSGPGGIDKPGYYLRDVGFYLADDEPDTLYALAGDGSADEDANLMRTEEPSFEKPEPVVEEPAYILPDSATRVYEYGELDVLDNRVLYLARNEIYARHGYIFQEGSDLASYFAAQSWYIPNEAFSENDLSDIERQNIDMIRSVEYNHGSEYQWS